MSRQSDNLEILKLLRKYILNNPTLRFNQALFNLDINEFTPETKEAILDPIYYGEPEYKLLDKYSEESITTLNKIKANL